MMSLPSNTVKSVSSGIFFGIRSSRDSPEREAGIFFITSSREYGLAFSEVFRTYVLARGAVSTGSAVVTFSNPRSDKSARTFSISWGLPVVLISSTCGDSS